MALPSFLSPKTADPEAVSLVVDGKDIAYWTEVSSEQSIDGYSTVGFSAPFEADRAEFRAIFQPFSYKDVQLSIGGNVEFTGTLLTVDPKGEPNQRTVGVTCYAKAAVLCDCEPPASAFPLEFNGMDIVQIGTQIGKPFGLTCSVEQQSIARDGSTVDAEFFKKAVRHGKRGGVVGGKGNKFTKLALHPGDKPQEFLVGLAKQRGLVVTDDAQGNILFRNSVTPGNPVARFEESVQPGIAVAAKFNPQEYYSEMTAWTSTTRARKGIDLTLPNPLAKGFVRPHSFKPDDTDTGGAPAAIQARMSRMLCNACSWDIEVPTWLDPSGNLFRPNTTVVVLWPSAMIFVETELLVRKVNKTRTPEKRSAVLEVVFPGAFSGEMPDSFPWSE